MWPRFGIKVGNSTLCIATVKSDGKIEVIANKQGDRVSQACLLFEGNEMECGLTAKQKMPARQQASVANSFQFLLPETELTAEKLDTICKYVPCEYDAEKKEFQLQNNTTDPPSARSISAQDVWVEFFKAEFELAKQSHFDESDSPAVVLSIPDYYPHESWTLLTAAAESAGFHVAQVIPEQTAAAVAYNFGEQSDEQQFVLCIKSGGLLSSFTLFEVKQGLYSVVETIGPFYIGGKQFTDVLVDFISNEFYKKYKLDVKESRRSMAKIRVAADSCKHCLTNMPTTQIYIDSLMDGVDFNMQMSRARYDMLIQPVLNRFTTILGEVKQQLAAKLPAESKISQIVLSGATLKIPKFQELIGNSFAEATLNATHAPDEVVAIGCAFQATCLIDPSAQDLEEKFTCATLNEDIYIWNDENVESKQLCFSKGSIAPNSLRIEIPGVKPVFFLETDPGAKHEVVLDKAEPVNGNYSINVAVEIEIEETSLIPKFSVHE